MRDPLVWGLAVSSEIADWSGDTGLGADEVRRNALEAVRIAEQSGGHFMRVWAYRGLGMAHLLHGEWPEAAEVLEEALAMAREQRNGLEREANILAHLSRAYLGQCDALRARTTATQSIACAERQGALFFECAGQLALARALRADPGATAAKDFDACVIRALELVGETGGRALEPQIVEERARLAQLCGDRAGASEALQRARILYVEIGATGHAARLAKELGS